MFEKFSLPAQEASIEIIHADFERQEKLAIKKGSDFLENLSPEKLKEKSAKALAVMCLVFAATSAVAEEQGSNETTTPPPEQEMLLNLAKEDSGNKNEIANFDWKKIVKRIEISTETTNEKIEESKAETVGSRGYYGDSQFYKNINQQEVWDTFQTIYQTLNVSQDAQDFSGNIEIAGQRLSEKQKVLMLQQIGSAFSATYNYDMLGKNEHVTVSRDKMFQSLKNQVLHDSADVSGICGNIHTFLTQTAQDLGIESALQSTGTEGGNHILSSLVVGGDQKEIAFLNYGTFVTTGTLNYQNALGVLEKYTNTVSAFNTYVANPEEVLFPVMSRAGELVQETIGVEGSSDALEQNLEKGNRKKEGWGEIKISPEEKKITLNSDTMGLSFTHFEDIKNNPYQSLKEMNALRGSMSFGGENKGIDVGVTVLNMDIKDLYDGSTEKNELALTFLGDYIDSAKLTKGEAGELLLNFGGVIEGALLSPLGKTENSKKDYLEGSLEASFGGKLIYINPQDTKKFYIDASLGGRTQIDNVQDQKFVIKKVADNIALGAEVNVFEASVLKTEVGVGNLDWGKSAHAQIGIENEKLEGGIKYEKKSSDFERFIPSSEKIEVGVNYKNGPKWQISFIGAKSTEKYKDAQSQNKTEVGVKLKINLW